MTNLFEETRNGNVALTRLNRPKQFNALNSPLAVGMVAAAEELDAAGASMPSPSPG
ncbi:hypothetical protein ATH84_101567 [Paracoccus versutus]|uniref:Enoyl-CoA hydratase n=1 Tax=Paracoccus versutus TaxID=34007 RepID=A0AAQ0HH32_PARVE|nr:hypothetical protein [Paracoccus versutus]REG46450.1 hypothetical protein ATH84_101567 [Paracoccus versutus]